MPARNWCLTINNYSDDEYLLMERIGETIGEDSSVKYLIFGKEIAPGTATPHLQGYIQFKKRLSLAQVKSQIGINHVHLEMANGSPSQNRMYCMKDDNFKEYGKISALGMYLDLPYMRLIMREAPRTR
jgi:hypothetical protein